MDVVRLVIVSRSKGGTPIAPATKKNSAIMTKHGKRPILLPSHAYQDWEAGVKRVLLHSGDFDPIYGERRLKWLRGAAIAWPVNCAATIYRNRLVGDAVGYYQAIGDLLQLVGVVENDRYIVQWDGTRLAKDPANPRIEVELTSVEGERPLFSVE